MQVYTHVLRHWPGYMHYWRVSPRRSHQRGYSYLLLMFTNCVSAASLADPSRAGAAGYTAGGSLANKSAIMLLGMAISNRLSNSLGLVCLSCSSALSVASTTLAVAESTRDFLDRPCGFINSKTG